MDSNTTQQTSANEESLNSVANNIAATLVAKQKDKEKRQLNLIHNIDESSATSGAERKPEDIAKVSKLLQEVLKVSCSITKAFRIGKERKASSLKSFCSIS